MSKSKRKRYLLLLVCLILVFAVVTFMYIKGKDNTIDKNIVPDDTDVGLNPERESIVRGMFTYKGKVLKQPDNISNILFVGVDSHVEDGVEKKNADFILLVVLNKKEKTLKPILIRKNITCSYGELDDRGQLVGVTKGEICDAYSYGKGELDSLANVKEAVSDLMCNIKIDQYISASFDLSSNVTNRFGGIKITTEKDLSFIDDSFANTDQITLNKDNVYSYLVGDVSKEDYKDIEKRQATFVSTVYNLFRKEYENNPNSIIDYIDLVSDRLCFNSNDIVSVADQCLEYTLLDLDTIDGYIEDNELVVNKDDLGKVCVEYIYNNN